jgi:parallel beta helix pectate lyase-like protein
VADWGDLNRDLATLSAWGRKIAVGGRGAALPHLSQEGVRMLQRKMAKLWVNRRVGSALPGLFLLAACGSTAGTSGVGGNAGLAAAAGAAFSTGGETTGAAGGATNASGAAGTLNGGNGGDATAVAGNGGTGNGANSGGGSAGGTNAGGSAVAGSAGAGGSAGVTSSCDSGASNAYYVDSASGDDAKDGRTPANAWSSIAKVNATTFKPGDSLCFRAGGSWTGQLHPLGSGTSGAPIVIDRYDAGAKPKFAGGANDLNAVFFSNQQYWELNNLEVTNKKSSLGDVRGISVRASNAGTLEHFYIRSCFVHDVTGVVNWIGGSTADNAPGVTFQTGWDASKRTGGIVFEVEAGTGTALKTKFDDVRIENNVIQDTSFGGIVFKQLDGSVHWGVRKSRTDSNWTPHTNLVIRGNFLSQSNTAYGCNAIYLTDAKGALLEGNVTKDAGTSAIELYYTDQVTVQKNETFGTKKKAGGADSNGIDSDNSTTASVIQYNYVHDNGDGILLCQFNFGDSVVRYNLLVNNSRDSINLHSDPAATNATYNNVLFVDGLGSASLVNTSGDGSSLAASYAFSNNIFSTTRTADAARTGSGVTYLHNLYSGLPAVAGDGGAKTGSPLFVNPAARKNGDATGPAFSSLDGFHLSAGSPALNAGLVIANNGGVDFWSTPLYVGAPDIGAYEAP